MSRSWPIRALLTLALLVALPVAGASAEVRLQKVGDFSEPLHVTGAPGDASRLYVVEQEGTIQVFRSGVKRQFVDLRSVVRGAADPGAGGEEGLLSMAFPPDFQTSRRFYVYFTQADGAANRVEELRAPTGDGADPASRRLVISIPHADASNHNGGQLQFGPDGLLYLAPGDGGTGGAPARDLESLLGKLLRIDPRGAAPGAYTAPADNPYVGLPGRDEIWLYGLRNPFRFSFDRANGDLVLGDVGQGTTEEIDHLPTASGRGRGADLGWNVCEGSFVTGSTTTPCSLTGSVLPAIEKLQDPDGYQSIIPGYVVRDPSLPSLLGRLVYGDFFVQRPRSARLAADGGDATDDREIGPQVSISALSSFGQDAGGCIYATSRNGPVYRLVENDTRIPCGAAVSIGSPGPGGAPRLTVRVPKRQRVLRLRGVVAYARCSERCSVAMGGRVRIGRRSYELRRATSRSVAAGKRIRIKARLTKRGSRAVRRALRDGRRPKAGVGLRARDVAGNGSRLARRTVRVKR
jgi:hypothetical protein